MITPEKRQHSINATKDAAGMILDEGGFPCMVIGIADKGRVVAIEIIPGGSKGEKLAHIQMLRLAIEALEDDMMETSRN